MNVYLVSITSDVPYPWSREYKQKATNEGPAISRSLKAYRKDLRDRTGRSKKITEFSLKVKNCGAVKSDEEATNG